MPNEQDSLDLPLHAEVAIELGGGPATAHARFALAAMTSTFEREGDA